MGLWHQLRVENDNGAHARVHRGQMRHLPRQCYGSSQRSRGVREASLSLKELIGDLACGEKMAF